MATTSQQSYANHVHRPRAWVVTWSAAAAALVLLVWEAYRSPSLGSIALVLLALATAVGVTLLRAFALRLQDRIIRLEMQIRLERLGRASDIARLTLKQMIALRFASDAELPALVDRAAAEGLTPDQIKRAVRDWQADYLRT